MFFIMKNNNNNNKTASLNHKKENIMNLLWDKKMKMSQQIKISNTCITNHISILNKDKQVPQTRREISLLSGRLNKLFPSEVQKLNAKISNVNSGSKTTK